jgi:hypothetical protein
MAPTVKHASKEGVRLVLGKKKEENVSESQPELGRMRICARLMTSAQEKK